jgi:hypothetical protein
MKCPYLQPDLSELEMEEQSALCTSGTGESFSEEGEFEGRDDWE